MNLLKSSTLSDLHHFIQSEDEEPPRQQNRIEDNEGALCGKKLLDSSLDRRLEPIPKHAFKPYQPPTVEQSEQQRPHQLFDFTVTQDYKGLSHSSYDFFRLMNTSVQPDSLALPKKYVPTAARQLSPAQDKQTDRWLDNDKQAHSEGESQLNETPQGPEQRHPKNETKNIPKNYGKAIITFIERNKGKVCQMLEGSSVTYSDIVGEFKHRKRNINTIEHLRDLWLHSKYAPQMRILSKLFLRKYALQYIFNSRITNYSSHIKYRHKLLEGVDNPVEFNNIKDY